MADSGFPTRPGATISTPRWTGFQAMGVAWLVYWMSNSYVWINDVFPFLNYFVIVGVYMLFFAVFRPVQVIGLISRPVIWAWALTAVIPGMMFVLGDMGSELNWQSAKVRIISFSVFAGSAIFLIDQEGPKILYRAAAVSLSIGIFANIADVFVYNPYNSAELVGRTAGFYGDANISAAAIGALLLLSCDVTKQTSKGIIVVGIALIAILSTMSRSGMIFGLFIATVYLFSPRGQDTFSVGTRMGIATVGLAGLVVVVVVAATVFDLDTSQAWRIQSMLTLDLMADTSAQGRVEGFQYGLGKFMENFWTGGGLASSRRLSAFPHNSFLEVGLDYGIFGVLTFTIIVSHGFFQMLRHGWARAATAGLLSLQYVFYSNFSHTVATNQIVMVIFAAFVSQVLIKDPENVEDNRVISPGSQFAS